MVGTYGLTLEERFWQYVAVGGAAACWPWQAGMFADDYGKFRGPERRAHRMAWVLVRGPIPAGLLVLHHCDNRPCCNPLHLFLGDEYDNMHDAMDKGRWRPGSVYVQSDIDRVRALSGMSQRQIAAVTGVSKSAVQRFLR